MNPSLGAVPASEIEVRLDRGTTLRGRLWDGGADSAGPPRGLVAIVHGLGEHSGRYAAFAGDLCAAGFVAVALDLPGHGLSPGARGDIPSWTALRDQVVPAMFTTLASMPGQPGDLPRLLFGHSMGAVIALDYALHHPREITAAVSSAAGLRNAMPPWWKLALANVALVAAPAVGFPHGLDESGMSRDAEVLKLRRDDPLMHDRISPRLYQAFTEAQQRAMREARRLAVPALLLHGEADRVTDPRGSAEFVAAAPAGLARLVTYPGAYHELLNDHSRADVMRDLTGWLEAAVAAA